MKKCRYCDLVTSDESSFCPKCGRSDFLVCTPQSKRKDGKIVSLIKSLLYPGLFFGITYLASFVSAVVFTVVGMNLGYESEEGLTEFVFELYNSYSVHISLITNLLFILVTVIIFAIRRKNICHEIGLRKFPPYLVPLCAVLGFSMQYVANFLIAIIPWPESVIDHFQESYSGIGESTGIILTILSVSVVTGITEELAFRSLPISRLSRAYGPAFSVTFASVIFGIAHMTPIATFYTILLGLLMGAVYCKYKSLWPCAIIHIFFNFASIVGLPTAAPTFILAIEFISFGLAILISYFILRKKQTAEEA